MEKEVQVGKWEAELGALELGILGMNLDQFRQSSHTSNLNNGPKYKPDFIYLMGIGEYPLAPSLQIKVEVLDAGFP